MNLNELHTRYFVRELEECGLRSWLFASEEDRTEEEDLLSFKAALRAEQKMAQDGHYEDLSDPDLKDDVASIHDARTRGYFWFLGEDGEPYTKHVDEVTTEEIAGRERLVTAITELRS